jgi:hypothetical protein
VLLGSSWQNAVSWKAGLLRRQDFAIVAELWLRSGVQFASRFALDGILKRVSLERFQSWWFPMSKQASSRPQREPRLHAMIRRLLRSADA